MPAIACTAPLMMIGSWLIVHLPKPASAKLPSRGMVMGEGTINGVPFVAPLEPDGKGSHWLHVDKAMANAAKTKPGDDVVLDIKPTEDWPEPEVPADLKKALAEADPKVREMWKATTVRARWDWIRSIRSTNNPETRKKRIAVACAKMKGGSKSQCCFNRSMCTVPEVSKGGVLIDPAA